MSKPTPAVVEAWAGLVRTERALLDKVEEALKRARLPRLPLTPSFPSGVLVAHGT